MPAPNAAAVNCRFPIYARTLAWAAALVAKCSIRRSSKSSVECGASMTASVPPDGAMPVKELLDPGHRSGPKRSAGSPGASR
jgi:hypothetical protein